MDTKGALRDGEIAISEGPDLGQATLRFIGSVSTSWREKSDCPKNLREARERGGGNGVLNVASQYRLALRDLDAGQWIIVLSWFDRTRRDLSIQTPKHAPGGRGTFALRSPVRPNPIGIHVVKILELDVETGTLAVDAMDTLDGTPLLDIKPFLPSVDVPPSESN